MNEPVVVVAGKNRVAVECLKSLIAHGAVIRDRVLVLPVSSDDGTDGWQPSLRAEAQRMGVREIESSDISGLVGKFISIEYDKIIDVGQYPSLDFFNIHFSLLPAYKGCWTAVMPILFGDPKTGVTLHCMDAGIDTGPIIAQTELEIQSGETASSLYEKLMTAGVELFVNQFEVLLDDSFQLRQQPLLGSSYFSRGAIDIKNTELPLNSTFEQLDRRVRAYYFPRFQTATFNGKPVSSVVVHQAGVHYKIGTVIEEAECSTSAQCIDSVIKLQHKGY